jgi:hypothetical protein
MRSAAIGCLVAGGAMLAGPGAAGCAVASADLLGIGIDDLPIIGDDDDRKDSGPPVTRVGAGREETEDEEQGFGIADSEDSGPPVARIGAGREETEDEEQGFGITIAGVVGDAGGSGGGAVPGGGGARPPSLPPVPTEPGARTVVIRAEPVPAVAAPVIAPSVVLPPAVMPPMPPMAVPAAPLAALPPGPPPPPVGPPPAVTQQPSTSHDPAPAEALNGHAPASFRAGYPEYLRAATVGGLVAAAVPGTTGILVLTTAGGLLGYRQARAAQTLPPANIARFLQ